MKLGLALGLGYLGLLLALSFGGNKSSLVVSIPNESYRRVVEEFSKQTGHSVLIQSDRPDVTLGLPSPVVFAVAPGNPKRIYDWKDLVREDVTVAISNREFDLLASWGHVDAYLQRLKVVQNGPADVRITVEPQRGEEIHYPQYTILTEPPVAIDDVNVETRGTREVAGEFVRYFQSDEARALIAAGFPNLKRIFWIHLKEAVKQ